MNLQNSASFLCLSPTTTGNGALMVQRACGQSVYQRWTFTSPGADGYFQIRNATNNLCLSIVDSSRSDGARANAWACGGYASQYWRSDRGWYVNKNSGKCFAIRGGAGQNLPENPIIQWGCYNTEKELWSYW